PATLATVLPSSPAGKAGFRKDDKIVDIDGHSIRTQTDLRFALGTKYAGDSVSVSAQRGDERLQRTVELAGELEPFRHAFLGILPMREATLEIKAPTAATSQQEGAGEAAKTEQSNAAGPPGIEVRFVYPDSPAAKAGINAGDRVTKINSSLIDSIKSAIDAMNAVLPQSEVTVVVERDGAARDVKLTVGVLPTNVPTELPPATAAPSDEAQNDAAIDAPQPKIELSELKLAEFPQKCQVYVPPSLAPDQSAGMVIWLHAPGDPPTDDLFRAWKPICDRDGLILVAPSSSDPARWERTELEYLRRLSERALAEYRVDRQRVVVVGREGGGAMAYLLALVSRDLFTGVAATAASLPRTITPPQAQPSRRLAVFAGLPADRGGAAQMQAGLKKLRDAGYPVTAISIVQSDGELSVGEREQLARWIDSLDRF
ncbi:MAG: PDZ domain-containing protein, partial [Pirellulales bacterium]